MEFRLIRLTEDVVDDENVTSRMYTRIFRIHTRSVVADFNAPGDSNNKSINYIRPTHNASYVYIILVPNGGRRILRRATAATYRDGGEKPVRIEIG